MGKGKGRPITCTVEAQRGRIGVDLLLHYESYLILALYWCGLSTARPGHFSFWKEPR